MDAGPLPRPDTRVATARATAATLAVGAVGGLVFYELGAPAAFLTGAALAVLAAVLLRMPTHLPDSVRTGTFAVLGVMMGAGVTADSLESLARLPVAIVGLCAVVAGATAASYQVLRRFGGWDSVSALCGSIPGNFSIVLAVSLERGARMEQVVMAQATRLFILVALVPYVIGGEEATGLRSVAPPGWTWADLVLTLGVAFAAAALARLARVPAPALLGPLVASVALSTSGLVTIVVPAPLAAAAFVILGAAIAVRFRGVRRDGLRRMLAASLLSFVAAMAVAVAVAAAVTLVLPEPFGALFLAYAPGALDGMVALSFLLHYEVAFVALLHTARMIGLSIGVPLLLAWWTARE